MLAFAQFQRLNGLDGMDCSISWAFILACVAGVERKGEGREKGRGDWREWDRELPFYFPFALFFCFCYAGYLFLSMHLRSFSLDPRLIYFPDSLYYPRIVCEIKLWLTLVYVQRIQLWPVKASFLSPMLFPQETRYWMAFLQLALISDSFLCQLLLLRYEKTWMRNKYLKHNKGAEVWTEVS